MSERDVVSRLNRLHTDYYGAIAAIVDHHHADVLTDAADLIERLTRELSEARQGTSEGERIEGWAAPAPYKPAGAWEFSEHTPTFTPGAESRLAYLVFPRDLAGTNPPWVGDCTTCGAPLIFVGSNPQSLQCPNPDCDSLHPQARDSEQADG
jgi:hypothetical protein